MSLRGAIFGILLTIGAVLNYASKPISQKLKKNELTVKVTGLVLVVVSMVLLMIYGK